MTEKRNVIRNIGKCMKCGEIMESKFRHDFQGCECGHHVDGGLDYQKRGGPVRDLTAEELAEYDARGSKESPEPPKERKKPKKSRKKKPAPRRPEPKVSDSGTGDSGPDSGAAGNPLSAILADIEREADPQRVARTSRIPTELSEDKDTGAERVDPKKKNKTKPNEDGEK